MWVVYLLYCADGTLYTGVTANLKRRLRQHNGELVGGARYTRSRRPVVLAWQCRVCSHSEALQLESRLKRLSRREKETLVAAGCEPDMSNGSSG